MKTSLLILSSAAGSVRPSPSAATVGVNFIDGDDTPFGSAVAGAPGYAQGNWNFLTTDWSGNAANDAPLAALQDASGAPAVEFLNVSYPGFNDPVHYDAANTWRSGAGNATPNDTLMNGYLDDGNDDQPYVNISLANSVTSATIVLYFHGDVRLRRGRPLLARGVDRLAHPGHRHHRPGRHQRQRLRRWGLQLGRQLQPDRAPR